MGDWNSLDIVIVLLVLSATLFGAARGFWLTIFEYVGVLGGFAVGALIAPVILARFDPEPVVRLALVMAILFTGAAIGSTLTHLVGEPVRRVVHVFRVVGVADSIGGALLTAFVMTLTLWYLGVSLSRGPNDRLAQAVQHSAVLRTIDEVAPPLPSPLARLERELSGGILPRIFDGLEPTLPSAIAPDPAATDNAAVAAAAASVVRIEAAGCGGIHLGSGFVVAPGVVLTNAHVVSGTRTVEVNLPGRGRFAARVVAFDSSRDLAALAVAGLELDALTPAPADRGDHAAIIGYPGGGSLTIVPAVISGSLRAHGRDIYNAALITREIWVVSGQARPGNSGGPLVDAEGNWIGVVFAGAVSRPGESYALTAAEAAAVVQAASTAGNGSLDMRQYDCVS